MSLTLSLALFFIIWWTVLFAVLPIGVKSQYENGEVVPGSEGAAPHKPMLAKKALLTTFVAAIVFGVVHLAVAERMISLDSIPFLPTFKD